MLAKIGRLWWLVIVCAFLAGVCAYPLTVQALYVASSYMSIAKQMYVGRTTLMESGQHGSSERQMARLGNIATSQAVLSNAAQTLSQLGMKSTPQEVLSHMSVMPVRDTNILAIEMTLPDPQEAKVAADVIASELKKAYADTNNASISQRREFLEAQIKPTREAMIRAQDALIRYRQGNRFENEANMAALTADLKSATDTYGLMRRKLDEAKIREQQSRNEAALKTIDPAFVRPQERPNPAKLVLEVLFSPWGGPACGVIVGLVFGLALGALIRKRRANYPSPQQGV